MKTKIFLSEFAKNGSLITAIYLATSVLGSAQDVSSDLGMQQYVSSADSDYVLTALLPDNWTLGVSYGGTRNFFFDLPTPMNGIVARGQIEVSWQKLTGFGYPFPDEIDLDEISDEIMSDLISGNVTSQQLDDIIPLEGCGDSYLPCVPFDRSYIEISNQQGLRIEYAQLELYDPDLNILVAPTAPDRFTAIFAPDIDGMIFRIRFAVVLECVIDFLECRKHGDVYGVNNYANTLLAPYYQSMLPSVLDFMASMQIRHYLDLDDETPVKLVFAARVQTSQRQAFWAYMKINLPYPADWQVNELGKTPANKERAAGRLVASVARPDDANSVGEAETLFIVLEGMDYDDKKDFLGKTEPLVELFLEKFELVETEAVDIENFRYFAETNTKFIRGTQKTYVNTYVGQDRYGADLKIRTYSVGAQTTVVNFLFVADAADFDRALPEIEEIINATQLILQTPLGGDISRN